MANNIKYGNPIHPRDYIPTFLLIITNKNSAVHVYLFVSVVLIIIIIIIVMIIINIIIIIVRSTINYYY